MALRRARGVGLDFKVPVNSPFGAIQPCHHSNANAILDYIKTDAFYPLIYQTVSILHWFRICFNDRFRVLNFGRVEFVFVGGHHVSFYRSASSPLLKQK